MLRSLTNPESVNTAYQEISALLREFAEWLFVSDSVSQSLRQHEIEVVVMRERLLLSCWTEQGTRLWRVVAWDWNGQLLRVGIGARDADPVNPAYVSESDYSDDSGSASNAL